LILDWEEIQINPLFTKLDIMHDQMQYISATIHPMSVTVVLENIVCLALIKHILMPYNTLPYSTSLNPS